jgi:uncharacterized protein YdhG (YjbR/CyaY superfamily)
MKKAKPAKRRGAAKSKRAPKTVEEYISSVPPHAEAAFQKMRAVVRAAVPPDAIETISYGILAFRKKRVLVWFAAFSNHCSLFPTAAVIEAFKDELKGFTTSKGTIQFPVDKPLPTALITKIVKARVAASEDNKNK